jgi:hypothetical protein
VLHLEFAGYMKKVTPPAAGRLSGNGELAPFRRP